MRRIFNPKALLSSPLLKGEAWGLPVKTRTPKLSGESLVEILVAIVILSSILVAAFSILSRAISTNTNVKNRVIALNIAREGFEGVRNIRDTNWLKYSGDRRNKWLCLDDSNVNKTACDQDYSTLIEGKKFYRLAFREGRYYLENSISATNETTYTNIDLSTFEGQGEAKSYQLKFESDTQRYLHSSSEELENSPFYREIRLRVEDAFGKGKEKPEFCKTTCETARLHVIVNVHWTEENRPESVTLEGYLYDFFARDDY